MLVLFLEGLLVGHWYLPDLDFWSARIDLDDVYRWRNAALDAGWVYPPLERS